VRQAAVDAGAYGIEVAREGLTEDDQSLIEKIRGNGAEVIALTDEERQAFVDATRPVYENWRERIGADLVGAGRGVRRQPLKPGRAPPGPPR
jgi:TRAP-type transport system periplasmic protein